MLYAPDEVGHDGTGRVVAVSRMKTQYTRRGKMFVTA